MFILIPIILIFLLFAYLKINEDISIQIEVMIYILMAMIVYVSYFIYKKIKDDMKIQEQNALTIELNSLKSKISHLEDEKVINAYKHKIEILEEELKENSTK